jgi:pimeloyl-ACP methyl ester carboxylesterase
MDQTQIVVADAVSDDLVFDVLVAGPVDGEPVILLHGFPETSWCWRHQLPALAGAGYRGVAPDQRGYSPGARPDAVEAYGQLALQADVLAIADSLGFERFHLVGHDWGGAVAWQVAGRHPHRLRTLTVLSTPHPQAFRRALFGGDQPAAERSTGDQAQRSSYFDVFRAEGSELGMLENDAAGLRMVFQATGLSERDAQPYIDALATPDALRAALNWYRAASLTDTEGLGPITMPTLYVWSTNDPALGSEAAEATAACVEGPYRFEVLDGVSHWISEHAPDEVNRLLLEHFASVA